MCNRGVESTQKLVSVIIPSYNHSSYIAEALESVLEQNYRKLEVIIVDNYSTDDTKNIVKPYLVDSRVTFIQFDNKGVIAAARNFGATLAKGAFIAFLDSDDVWHKDKLAIQLNYFTEEVSAVASQFQAIGDIKSHYNHLNLLLNKSDFVDFSYDEILDDNPVITSSLIMRRDDFNKLGGFDESKCFICIEDWELWLRLCQVSNLNIRVINQPLVKYRVIISPSRKHTEIESNKVEVYKKHLTLHYITRAQFKKASGLQFYRIGICGLKNNNYIGIKSFFKSLVCSNSLKVRLFSLFGVVFFFIPFAIRKVLIQAIRTMRSKLFIVKEA